MTICVAALADGGKTIIAAADRMVTVQALSLEVERRKSKVVELGKHHLLMTAGDGFVGDELARELRSQVRSHENIDVEALAACLNLGYVALRARRVEQTLLRPIGYTADSFRETGAKLGNLAAQVLQSMANFDLGSDVLLAGFADDYARLAHVGNPGVLRWTDSFDFYAVGSGAMHAFLALLLAGCAATLPAEEVLFHVYVAKRSAESAPGVGNATDLYVCTHDGIRKSDAALLDELQSAYEKSITRRHAAEGYVKLKELLVQPRNRKPEPVSFGFEPRIFEAPIAGPLHFHPTEAATDSGAVDPPSAPDVPVAEVEIWAPSPVGCKPR